MKPQDELKWMMSVRDQAVKFLKVFTDHSGNAPKLLLQRIQNDNFTIEMGMLIHYLNQEIDSRLSRKN